MRELSPAAGAEVVILAAGEGTLLNLLLPGLRAFQREFRGQLRVLTRDRDQALSAVQLGEAHLAVTVVDEVPVDRFAWRSRELGPRLEMTGILRWKPTAGS